jgi:hypothetical protein
MASPFLHYVRRREGFWTLRDADGRTNDPAGPAVNGLRVLSFQRARRIRSV